VELSRGEIRNAKLPGGKRPVVVVTRDGAIPSLAFVTVAPVTETIRDLPTEVRVGPQHGLDAECVVNCDSLFTVPKSTLGRRRGELDRASLEQLGGALRIALAI
jgi:mRNA interferase MazF